MAPPNQDSIINLIMEALADQLEEKLITELDGYPVPQDEAIAGLARIGKLQDDPTFYIISVLIHPAVEEWPHVLWDPRFVVGFKLPNAYEIGGEFPVSFLVRRFKIELKMFFDGEVDRSVAQTKANLVLSRAEHAIITINMGSIVTDSFGETAMSVQVTQSDIREGGGEGTFIWRGKILIEFLTQRDPT